LRDGENRFLEEYRKLEFVRRVLGLLGKFILLCDAIVFALFVLVASLLAIHSLLRLIGVDVVAMAKWIVRGLPGR
jgi:hypothetical protein